MRKYVCDEYGKTGRQAEDGSVGNSKEIDMLVTDKNKR